MPPSKKRPSPAQRRQQRQRAPGIAAPRVVVPKTKSAARSTPVRARQTARPVGAAQRLRRRRLLVIVVAAVMVLSLLGVASLQFLPQVTGSVGARPSPVISGVATATP